MTAIAHSLAMQERIAPSRPSRLGTRRRRAAARGLAEPGASRFRAAKAPSLDTEKLLATSVREWASEQMTEQDYRAQQWAIHKQLLRTIKTIWLKHRERPLDDGDAQWWAAYENTLKPLKDESSADRYRRVEAWLRKNKPKGRNADVLKWERTFNQLNRCQQEWIAYRAACCGTRTAAIAVPIGCNHRLCPLCAWHRSQVARVRIKSMFDRLTHPIFITLTIPNQKTLHKHDYTIFRQRVRKLLAQYKGYVQGGVYSIETTYNRTEKTWHVHAHILADAIASLPPASQKINLAGRETYAFLAIKLRMEFDWLRLWRKDCGTSPRRGAAHMDVDGDRYEFEKWVRKGWDMALKERRGGKLVPIAGLSDAEIVRRTAWNAKYRRVIDVRPVDDREKAAKEVLKYITKSADFSDTKEAVETFCDAVKGARLIQTFGSWYGAKFDTDFDPKHLDDWGEMKCTCGLNHWERIGVVYRDDVQMDESGRWHLKRTLNHTCGGTVPRPTIRALNAPAEER